MNRANENETKKAVRERYAEIVTTEGSCCGTGGSCGGSSAAELSAKMGYSAEEMAGVPDGANLGLGCGNPQAIAQLREGESVLDLGSGAGFDCFLAARRVGPSGRVVGVDMTAEMIEKARRNAAEGDFGNVEFRLGEIEHLPVADATVDVILSNCVINLAPDKRAVLRDAFRVLKPGGRLAISDMVATAPLPAEVASDLALLIGCVSGAISLEDYERFLRETGFEEIRVSPKQGMAKLIREWDPNRPLDEFVVSANIEGRKPASA